MPTLGSAYVQIIPSAQGIKGKITEALGGEPDAAGNDAGERVGNGLIGNIKKIIAAAGIGAALKSAITEGAALEQSLGGIKTLFGDAANTVTENAQKAFRTAGVSANEYMENVASFSASLINSLGGDTAKAAEIADIAMVDMSDNVNKFGGHIEDVQNAYQGFAKQNFTMLDNLKLGYGGTKEEMQRLLDDAEKLSGVHYDISSFADISEAIHVIQENMGIAGATAEEASTTISGSFASMKAAAQNFAGALALGMDIKPVLQDLLSTAVTFAGNLLPAIGNVLFALPEVFTEAFTMASASVKNFFASGQLVDGLEIVTKISEQIKNNAGTMIDAGLNLLMDLADGLAASLPALIAYVPTIVTNIADIINENAPKLLITAGEIILTLGRGLIQAIPALIANIPQIIQAIVSVFTAFNWVSMGTTVVTGIKNAIQNLPSALKTIATNAVNGIKSAFSGSGIANIVSNVFNAAKTKIMSVLNSALSFVKGIVTKLKNALHFSWSLPKLKLPHISVTGGVPPYGIGGKGSLPKFSISWYKKAMDGAMLLDDPTIFGMNSRGFLGGGEAGNEFVVGQKLLEQSIARGMAAGGSATVVYNQTFNSPKAMTRREVLRQTKNTVRELRAYV